MNPGCCHMREALRPEQVPKMLEFLAVFNEFGKMAASKGIEPNVGSFLLKYQEIKTGYVRNLGNNYKARKRVG